MEYNRLVAYIYSYDNGRKNLNSGFARVEVRNDNIKFRINMKTSEPDSYSIWGIYLFFRKEKHVCGIKLGEMSIKNGVGEFAYIGNATDIEKSGIGFEQIKGIFLISGQSRELMFASEWDDEGFDTDAIRLEDVWQKQGEVRWYMSEKIDRYDDSGISEEHDTVAKETESETIESKILHETKFRTAEVINETRDTYEKDTRENSAESYKEKDDYEEGYYKNVNYNENNDYNKNDEYDKNDETDKYYEMPDQFNRMWELLSRDKEKQFLFADDELYDVVEITPDDIDKMPNTNWHLKNNSFVNHGFYNFRHLIAGKMYNDGNSGYFIGVPGIYNRRERSIASMYGFNRFKFSMRSDMRLNQFGYWYREITD